MTIGRFEDLECWKEARVLVNTVYEAIHSSERFRGDYQLKNQITDAAVSSMSNIAEGFSRRTNREFIQYLFISKSSATEVQSEAYVALDQKYITQKTFENIYSQAEKVSRLNSGFISYLLKNEKNYKNSKVIHKTQETQRTL
jgi:four helix bundle protein